MGRHAEKVSPWRETVLGAEFEFSLQETSSRPSVKSTGEPVGASASESASLSASPKRKEGLSRERETHTHTDINLAHVFYVSRRARAENSRSAYVVGIVGT